ncbi:uncharacterized protein LOC106152897 [Lingula anatina]|uniref:Uncharacterized protein LOC106152897 n=1 Tax=Lingula anatina TaxID=7574 RepID=A0A1S3H9E5_LINAN|nr:uncharacterized protein LOC106152897 [Lingula anatina]|eukprot:XP_013382091.1 uncharacterized protein LOC106152897 [Lingula anatina]
MSCKLGVFLLVVLALNASSEAWLVSSFVPKIITSVIQKVTSKCPDYPDYTEICDLKKEVKSLQSAVQSKVNLRNSEYNRCKAKSDKLKEIQTEFGKVVELYKEITFRVHQMIFVAKMRGQYGNFDSSTPLAEMAEIKSTLEKLKKLKTDIDTGVEGFILDFLENQVSDIVGMVIPLPASDILGWFGISSNKDKQRKYRDELKKAKSDLQNSQTSVTRSLARVQSDCKLIDDSWPKIRAEISRSLKSVMTMGADLKEAFPDLGIKLRTLNTNIVNFITGGSYSEAKAKIMLNFVKWELKYMQEEFYPKLNNAMKDIFGTTDKDQLAKLIRIADDVAKQMKIDASLDAIMSTIAPIDATLSILDILRMQAKLFPKRKCYRIYPFAPARNNQKHPTYDVTTTQALYSIRDAIKNGLAFAPNTCAGVDAVRKVTLAKESQMTNALFNYLLKTIDPSTTCAPGVTGDICA